MISCGAATSPATKAALRIASAHSCPACTSSGPPRTVPKSIASLAVSASREAWSSACNVLVRRRCSSSESGGPVTSDRKTCAWRNALAASDTDMESFLGRTGSPRFAAASVASTELHTAASARAIVRRTASTATIGAESADNIIGSVIAGQQRRAIDRARGMDEQMGDDGKKHQRDHGGDQFEQYVRDGQPLSGNARADSRQRGAGRRSDVLPDNQRTSLVQPDGTGE